MDSLQEQYDQAMLDFSRGQYDQAIEKLKTVLQSDPNHFDAQLGLGMAYYRKGDYPSAIAEGLKAERLRPHDQLVHTNLSLFFMKAGDKATAEHHGLQARIAGWRAESKDPAHAEQDPELQIAKPKLEPVQFPSMPWKKKPNSNKPPDS